MYVRLVTLWLVLYSAGSFQGVVAKAISGAADACNAGWVRFENHCYLFGSSKVTWSHGQTICASYGGNLASIPDRQEQSFIVSRARGDMWIGLVKIGGVWRWYDGTVFTYFFWAPGEPNNHKGSCEDCGEIIMSAYPDGKWNDDSCTRYQFYLCKV